jgi:hypothetical protein
LGDYRGDYGTGGAADWVIIVVTTELAEQPVEQSPRTTSLLAISGCHAPGFSWAISEMFHTDDLDIAQALLLGTAIAVGNGLYKDGRGMSAFIIEVSMSAAGRLIGVNIVTGETDCLSISLPQ